MSVRCHVRTCDVGDENTARLQTTIMIPRTEQLEHGHMVSELEARMLRALSRIDEDDAHDHLVKTKGLTARALSDVVVAEGGIPWLTTEAELLEEFPEFQRAAFHKAAAQRAAMLEDVVLPVMVITGGPDDNANPALNVSSEVVLTQVEGDEVADLNGRTNGETAAQLMRKQTRGSGGKDFLGLWD